MSYKFALAAALLLKVTPSFAADIPVNVGVGPAAFFVPEHLDDEDPEPFYGLRLHVKAIIDQATIKKNKNKIPEAYRAAVAKVDEVRVGYLLIPESIMLGSRKTPHGPEVYGATWRPLGVGLPIKMGPARLALGTGLLVTYAYINTGDYKIIDQTEKNVRKQVTHFFRPGADLTLDFEVKFTDSFLASVGWSSAYYVPQEIGGDFTALGMDDLQNSIWRIHQAYAMLHYRFPVEVHM